VAQERAPLPQKIPKKVSDFSRMSLAMVTMTCHSEPC
jgi:hypothetical protein